MKTKRALEYDIWNSMIQRCHNPKNRAYPRYGGRGIQVCARWRHSFKNFITDVGPRPTVAHSLDRKRNDGDYEPRNVRWATPIQQGNNSRINVVIEHDGQSMTVAEWARTAKLPVHTLYSRLRLGWPMARALTPTATRQMSGTTNGSAKLTATGVAAIRVLASHGVAQTTLAGMFGVSQAQIGRVVRREHWNHL